MDKKLSTKQWIIGTLIAIAAAGTGVKAYWELMKPNGSTTAVERDFDSQQTAQMAVTSPISSPPDSLKPQLILHFDGDGGSQDLRPPTVQVQLHRGAAETNGLFGLGMLLGGDGNACQEREAGWGPTGVQITQAGAWNFGATDFTIDCWINTPSLACQQDIWAIPGPSGSVEKISLWITADGRAAFRRQVSGNPDHVEAALSTPVNAIVPGTWTHIALVRSNWTLSLYVNGKLLGEQARTTWAQALPPQGETIWLGAYWWDRVIKRYSNLVIDEFRVCQGAAWKAPFTPPDRSYLVGQ